MMERASPIYPGKTTQLEEPKQCEKKQKTIQDIGWPLEKHLTGRSKGIIINNTFEGVKNQNALPGFNSDVVNIVETFGNVNVDFKIEKNLNANDMRKKIHCWLQETKFDETDCAFCFILTHGDDKGVLFGEDGYEVEMKDVKAMFIDCKGLVGKPKLFFVQACRGEVDPDVVVIPKELRKASIERKAKDADVFQFFATVPGKISWVGCHGSMFITTLCSVVQAYGGKKHLHDIVTKVNEMLSKDIRYTKEGAKITTVCEVSEAVTSLTYNLYFNDGNSNQQNEGMV